MKTTIISLLSVYLLPAVLSAQPTISTNELYHIGDVIEMINCNAAGLSQGASGAGVTWDFSGLVASGGVSTTTVAHDTSTTFLTSNLLVTLPNGLTEYMNENNTDSYIDGIFDPNHNLTYHYYNCDLAKRPFTYNTYYVDTYRVVVATPATVGTGVITETGDGYGTLILPTGTHANVLRIKKQQIETDSMGGAESAFSTLISYLWFDGIHTAPLLRIDSSTGIGGTVKTAMYLTVPSGIKNFSSSQNDYTACITNNMLVLTGIFEYGKQYEVAVYSIIGTKIFDRNFTAYENAQRFDMERQVKPGIYMVSITSVNDKESPVVMKVIKQ